MAVLRNLNANGLVLPAITECLDAASVSRRKSFAVGEARLATQKERTSYKECVGIKQLVQIVE